MDLEVHGSVGATEVRLRGRIGAADCGLPGAVGIGFDVSRPNYPGPYEATPSQSEQTFRTNGTAMTDDFTVHKIPSNYGLITYNGFELMVS